jgi:alkyldihydroxyacetonephosphate synthase
MKASSISTTRLSEGGLHDSRIVPDCDQALDDGGENENVWGFTDTRYQVTDDGHVEITGDRYPSSGQKLPSLLPWITNLMKVDFPREQETSNYSSLTLPPSIVNDAFVAKIQSFLEDDQITFDPRQRLRNGHGHSQEDMYDVNYGHVKRIPDIVLLPQNQSQVQSIVNAAREAKVRLVPYGGGTNVSQALSCSEQETRMIASVGMRHMNRVLWIDKVNRMAGIEAGAVGRNITATLSSYGMMLGHEPDSVEFSTLGGWIATKASGMKKNKYGNIEDIVLDIEMVTLAGAVVRVGGNAPPRESVGSDLRSFIFGSEGSLGIVTSAVVKIFPLPEIQKYGSILFRSFEHGMAFMYDLTQTNQQPASVRLVDNTQFQFSIALKPPSTGIWAVKSKLEKAYVTKIRGFDPQEMVACTLVFEGNSQEVKVQEAAVYSIARKHGGMKAGADNGERGYQMTFAIAYIRDFAMSLGIMAESFETSCAWSHALDLCRRVKRRVQDEHKALKFPGEPFVTARISQVYDTGVTVYFYVAVFSGAVKDPSSAYGALEEAARDEILKCGGSLSHHHGIGELRRKFLPRVLSPGAMAYRRAILAAVDPDNVFGGAGGDGVDQVDVVESREI